MAYAKIVYMGYERRISIFRNGRNQAVRIPKEFELPGTEAVIRRDGNRLMIEPVGGALPATEDGKHLSLGEWLATLDPLPLEDHMAEIEDYPPEPIEL